ncbi:hypothetical protein IMG5_160280 [Ichthyophthirius multifiliis]|uniref:Uncharacterized protein n=1 Tax=Ichthyophthirius multifiliis TaxID=5932 RepID=G0QZW7_ICHMU|nr:hypothetical protein IMG5_160280 [Ichthyophthirius multifiliis]EGR29229.1 hypothetical protein IMG5_160280 [Ichthyophthirius multifiliis]|eukprot:XP_004030465.1 hypothetical protein IMG5_160280 [Ichthyophthirius multifiliis]
MVSLYIEEKFIDDNALNLLSEYFKDFIYNLITKLKTRQQFKKIISPEEIKKDVLFIIQNDQKLVYKAIKTLLTDQQFMNFYKQKKCVPDTVPAPGKNNISDIDDDKISEDEEEYDEED